MKAPVFTLILALGNLPEACLGDVRHKDRLGELVNTGTVEEVASYFADERISGVPDYVYRGDFTLLHIAIGNRKNPDVIAYLVDRGANILAEAYRGRTSLLLAIDNGNVPAVEIFTEIEGYAAHAGDRGVSATAFCKDVLTHYRSNEACNLLLQASNE